MYEQQQMAETPKGDRKQQKLTALLLLLLAAAAAAADPQAAPAACLLPSLGPFAAASLQPEQQQMQQGSP